jgi:hypothetical protein
MDIKEAKAAGFFKQKFEIGDHFYNEDGTTMKKRELFVTLREPTAAEFEKLGGQNNEAQVKTLQSLLPKCIVDHNFTNGEDAATNQEVGAVIMGSSGLFYYLVTEWQKSLPLAKRNASILNELEDQPSTKS